MKQLRILLLTAALLGLTACGHAAQEPPLAEGGSETPAPGTETSSVPGNVEQSAPEEPPAEEPDDTGDRAALACYRTVLEGIYWDRVYPDGGDCGYDGFGELSDNRFAVVDIDGDGKKELIVSFTTSCMAGMVETIYGYDAAEDTVTTEFAAFPMLTYYDNGMIAAGWSHNMGKAGPDFWPYDLFRYSSKSDAYELAASLDAWDRSIDTENFPEDADAEHSGIVFYIMEDGSNAAAPVGKSDYEAWRASVLGNAAVIEPPYQYLTPENIEAVSRT